jgi:hypothetical protein
VHSSPLELSLTSRGVVKGFVVDSWTPFWARSNKKLTHSPLVGFASLAMADPAWFFATLTTTTMELATRRGIQPAVAPRDNPLMLRHNTYKVTALRLVNQKLATQKDVISDAAIASVAMLIAAGVRFHVFLASIDCCSLVIPTGFSPSLLSQPLIC